MAKRKQQRKPTKRKTTTSKRKPNNFNSKLKTINLILAISIVTILMSTFSYFFLLKDKSDTQKSISKVEIKKDELDLKKYSDKKLDEFYKNDLAKHKFEEYTPEFEKEYVHTKPIKKQTEVIKNKEKKEETKISTKEKSVFEKSQEKTKPELKPELSKNPKLAIVIDDVTNKYQVKKILDTNLKITMSILPPTPSHKNSAKIARDLPFYMIHFPMQAVSFNHEEKNTLHVGDSYEKIEKRVKQLRKWYPEAIFTNNHTGSKFTADKVGMDHLIRALKKYDFIFVDSRTTAKSVAKEVTEKYNMPYITRNVFIDNKKDFNYIQNQLKKAIKIAKKNGYAMAIGHPYDVTIQVIDKSKHLFKGLDIIYVKDLPIVHQ